MAERRNRPVPLNRRWVNDIIHFGKKAHVIGCSWTVNLGPLVAAKAAAQSPIGWSALWMKAIGLVARRRSELRTAYMPFPWAHFYVHPECVCTAIIERTWRGGPAVFAQQFPGPESLSLAELDRRLRDLRQHPVENFVAFRRLIFVARLPILLRRLIWHVMLYWLGSVRSQVIGTFTLNPFPTGGAVTLSAPPTTWLLYYGLVAPNGDMPVQLFFDHRVADGIEAFKVLSDIVATLNRDVVKELQASAAGQATAPESLVRDGV